MNEDRKTELYFEGYDGHNDGLEQKDNPYPIEDEEYTYWYYGWKEANDPMEDILRRHGFID